MQHPCVLSKARLRLVAICVIALALIACDRRSTDLDPSASAKAQEIRADFDRKLQCLDVGRRFWEKEFSGPRAGEVAMSPMYTYARDLNTCVVFAGFISKSGNSEYIIDVLSNRELASHIQTGSGVLGLSSADFEKRKKTYFPDLPY